MATRKKNLKYEKWREEKKTHKNHPPTRFASLEIIWESGEFCEKDMAFSNRKIWI